MIIAYRILQTIIPLILLFYINPVHAGLFSATQTSITLGIDIRIIDKFLII
jgi:hypothetical protein